MTRTWLSVVVAAVLLPAVAHADEVIARKLFDEGERAYNLGDFAKASELFRKAYEEWPEPAFLFNLAQTYRQAGDCKQASFFYKRFLALKEQDTKKPIKPELKVEVEKRIVELDECVKGEIASKPPTSLDGGTGGTGGTGTGSGGTGTGTGSGGTGTGGTQVGTGGTGGDDGTDGGDDGEEPTTTTDAGPSKFVLRVLLGTSRLSAGPQIDKKFQFGATLTGAYPLSLGPKFRLDLGAALWFTPVKWRTTETNPQSGSSSLIGLLANVGPTFQVASKISVRADVGLGLQLFTGLSKMNNPFTEGGATASGALSTFLLRGALSADYQITPNIVATLMPIAFTHSAAPKGFDSSIPNLRTISIMAGIAYQQ